MTSVPAPLCCDPSLDALATICFTVTPRRPLLDVTFMQWHMSNFIFCKFSSFCVLLCLPVQLKLLGGHVEFPVLRVSWFSQVMLAGRFGLTRLQVLISSLNLLSPQVLLQYEVFIQFPKMKGARRKVLISVIQV